MGLMAVLILVPLLSLVVVRFLDGATARSTRRARFLGWIGQSKLWHVVLALMLSACAFAGLVSQHDEWFLPAFVASLLVLVLLVRGWVQQFLFLMSLHDDDLPGRYDKLIWASVLLALPPLGLWLFRTYRESRWPEPAPVKAEAFGGMI